MHEHTHTPLTFVYIFYGNLVVGLARSAQGVLRPWLGERKRKSKWKAAPVIWYREEALKVERSYCRSNPKQR